MENYHTDYLYIRADGTPRNYIEPELHVDLDEEDILSTMTEADVQAFRSTQKWIAVGITAVGGTLANVINPPEDFIDFISNMSIPSVIQGLNYMTFRKGIGLMRRRAQERHMHIEAIIQEIEEDN